MSIEDDFAAFRGVAGEELDKLREENADLHGTLDAVIEADERAVELWRAAHPGNELVIPDRARLVEWLLEQNAALRADKDRLDWVEKARPIAWALGGEECGEYWLLTDIGEKHPEEAEEFPTLRAAIDAARKEAQP